MWPGPRPTSIPSGILIQSAIWPQQTWAENWGLCPFGEGAGSPSNTTWPGPRPTSMPSFILIHPTVWPQYTNITDRQDRQDRQTDNGSIAQGKPFYKWSPRNSFTSKLNSKCVVMWLLPHLIRIATLPRDLSLTTACSNRRQFSDITVSRGNVVTHLRCNEIFNHDFTAKLPVSLSMKEFQLECGPMPNVMAALPNIGGALFNAAKFGWCSLPEFRAVKLPRCDTH